MIFNQATFPHQIDGYDDITVENEKDAKGDYYFHQETNTTGNLNTKINYNKGGFEYTTWYQELSKTGDDTAMLVSCKIDFHRTLSEDDHMTVMLAFQRAGSKPELLFAQVFVTFQNSEDNNFYTPLLTGDDIPGQVYDSMNDKINSADFGDIHSSEDGRSTLPDIAKANVYAMSNCVSY